MFKLHFFLFLVLILGLCYGREERCNLISDPGICYGYEPMFTFDTETGACKNFVFGGCGGNENKFTSLQECRDACEN